jgi:acetolactate synthase-1/2/3 large subunit
MDSERMTMGAIIDETLAESGVTHLFTLNGGHIWPLLQAAESSGLRLIDVRDERTAAFAAEGWSRITRTCGVAAVTAGPGVTNTVSALAAARASDSPLLVIGGRAPKATWGMGALQEMDHIPVVASLTKSACTVEDPGQAVDAVRSAMRSAMRPRTGPVFVDVPADVLFAEPPRSPSKAIEDQPLPSLDRALLDQVRSLIEKARRPVAIAGGTVWWAHAEVALLRFVERCNIPVLLNGTARGMVPPEHRLFRSHARSTMMERADLLLVIGAPLDFRFGFGATVPPDTPVVYIDADDAHVHRRAAVGLFGDVRSALLQLAEADAAPSEEWLETTAAEEQSGRARDQGLTSSNATPIHPARLVAEVAACCSENAVIVGDGGDFVSFAGRLIHRRAPGLWLDAGPFGCLGSGVGYGMAAKLANPDRQVVVLSGDGALGFCAMDIDTLVRHRIPIVVVVGNNGILALEKHPMLQLLGTSVAADLNWAVRYDRLVEALGGYGELVERPEDIAPALQRAFASGVPACLDVRIDPNATYPRRASLL